MITYSNAARTRHLACALTSLALLAACGGGSDEPATAEAESGFLRLAPGDEVLAAEKPASSPAVPTQPVEKPPVVVETEQPKAKPAQPPAPRDDLGPAPDASDLELSAALLQRPYADFVGLLAQRAGDLPAERRELLTAFSAALAGQIEPAARLAEKLAASPRVSSAERERLQRALTPGAGRSVEAGMATTSTPLERAMDLALVARAAREAATAGRSAEAARLWSDLLLAELQSPWETDRAALAVWSQALMEAQAGYRWNVRGDWPGFEVTVRPGDSLIAIRKRVLAERPDLLLCTGLIARANGLANENAIRPDDVLRIPVERASALVDVSSRWALFLIGGEVVGAWEVGVGKEQGSTRLGTYTIGDKQSEPMWFQPGRAPVPFGDPENPLGTRWLAWNEGEKGTSLGFHGTSDPDGVGGRVSLGCVRMRNADVEQLFEVLPRGATVVVQP